MKVITADVPPTMPFTKPATQDLVVTFRNLHNWLGQDAMKAIMQEAYNSLKEGGHFGVVEHRAPEGSDLEFMKKSGYVTQSLAIQTAQEVGFKLLLHLRLMPIQRIPQIIPEGFGLSHLLFV